MKEEMEQKLLQEIAKLISYFEEDTNSMVSASIKFGETFEESFEHIWNGERFDKVKTYTF